MMRDYDGRCNCVVFFGIRSGQTSLRKLVTDLNTDCNHQGPQQGWNSSADGCQLYHPPGNPDSGDGGQRADSRLKGEKDLQIRHIFLLRHTAAWTTGEEMRTQPCVVHAR